MLFGKKFKDETKTFNKYYDLIMEVLDANGFSKEAKFEVLPAMHVVCDVAANRAGKDRKGVSGAILSEIRSRYGKIDMEKMIQRCDIYIMAIRNKPVRGECMPMAEMHIIDAISKLAIMLGDVLFNPLCATDYYNAKYKETSLEEQAAFGQKVVAPIMVLLSGLYTDMLN